MILVRNLTEPDFGVDANQTGWTEHHDVADVDTLVANMQQALASDEYAPRPREFEVIEITVTRRVKVQREVNVTVGVNITEDEEEVTA